MTLSELQSNVSLLNWTQYFENAFSKVHRPIDSEEVIVNYALVYLKNLTSLVQVRFLP